MSGVVTLRLCLSPARRDFAEDPRADATLRRVFALPGGHFIRHRKTVWYAVPDLAAGVAESYVGLFRIFGVPDHAMEIAS